MNSRASAKTDQERRRSQLRRSRNLITAASLMLLIVTGCGSSNAGTNAAPDTAAPTGTTSSTPAGSPGAPSSAPSLTTGKMSFTYTANDGTTLAGDVTVTQLVPASRQSTLSSWLTAATISSQDSSDPLGCLTIDPQRDVLIGGTVAFTNTTPSFTPRDVHVMLQDTTDILSNRPQIGVGYTGDATCADVNGGSYGKYPEFNPSFSSAHWGPVPFVAVVHGYYSPAHPDGDVRMFNGYPTDCTDPGGFGCMDPNGTPGVLRLAMPAAGGKVTGEPNQQYLQGAVWLLGLQALSLTPGAPAPVMPSPSA